MRWKYGNSGARNVGPVSCHSLPFVPGNMPLACRMPGHESSCLAGMTRDTPFWSFWCGRVRTSGYGQRSTIFPFLCTTQLYNGNLYLSLEAERAERGPFGNPCDVAHVCGTNGERAQACGLWVARYGSRIAESRSKVFTSFLDFFGHCRRGSRNGNYTPPLETIWRGSRACVPVLSGQLGARLLSACQLELGVPGHRRGCTAGR